jgi:hypothetical protein
MFKVDALNSKELLLSPNAANRECQVRDTRTTILHSAVSAYHWTFVLGFTTGNKLDNNTVVGTKG